MTGPDSTELNFGKSIYIREYLGSGLPPQESDMIVKIPHEEPIEEIPSYTKSSYLEPKRAPVEVFLSKSQGSDHLLAQVRFPLKRDNFDYKFDYKNDMVMHWIPQRREWIVLTHHMWQEDACNKDESWGGPFQLDEYCEGKVLEGFGVIPRLERGKRDWKHVDPTTLQEIGREYQRVTFGVAFREKNYYKEQYPNETTIDWISHKGIWVFAWREYGLGHAWHHESINPGDEVCQGLYEAFGLSKEVLERERLDILRTPPRQLASLGELDSQDINGRQRYASEVLDQPIKLPTPTP